MGKIETFVQQTLGCAVVLSHISRGQGVEGSSGRNDHSFAGIIEPGNHRPLFR